MLLDPSNPSNAAEHEWVEVIPSRVFGGDIEPKMAVQCRKCGLHKIITEEDAKYILTTKCPGGQEENEDAQED